MSRPRAVWAVLISGRGSNLAALLDLRAEIDLRLVVSSDPRAGGLLKAKRAGVRTVVTPYLEPSAAGKMPKLDWLRLDQILKSAGITNLCLAGFMRVIPASFVEAWRGRIINLHPSLLPQYPGLNSIERAYAECAPMGLTVHDVNEEIDGGKHFLSRCTLRPSSAGGFRLFERSQSELDLSQAEFFVHVDEQRCLKHVIVKQDLKIRSFGKGVSV